MNGGLIGALGSGLQKAKIQIKAIVADSDKFLLRVMVLMVVSAALIATIKSVVSKDPTWGLSTYQLLALGVACVLAEYIGMHKIITSWHQAKPGHLLAGAGIWACGFAYAVSSTFTASAENSQRMANNQRAMAVSYQDARTSLDAQRAQLKADEDSLKVARERAWATFPVIDGKTIETKEAAQAVVTGMEGNQRFFVQLTNRCTAAQGPAARKFCADHAAARAAVTDLAGRDRWQGEVKAIEAQVTASRQALLDAQKTAQSTQTVTQEHTAFVVLASYVSGAPVERVAWIEPAQQSITNMALVSFCGLLMALMGISGRPRMRWGRGRLRHLLIGGEPIQKDRVVRDEIVVRNTELAQRLANATARRLAASVV